MYEVATTDDDGNAKFQIRVKSAGTILLTVSGPSVNAVTKTITVKKAMDY